MISLAFSPGISRLGRYFFAPEGVEGCMLPCGDGFAFDVFIMQLLQRAKFMHAARRTVSRSGQILEYRTLTSRTVPETDQGRIG